MLPHSVKFPDVAAQLRDSGATQTGKGGDGLDKDENENDNETDDDDGDDGDDGDVDDDGEDEDIDDVLDAAEFHPKGLILSRSPSLSHSLSITWFKILFWFISPPRQ